MRKLLSLICVLAIPCASWAQDDKASWTNLSALQPGEKIQVVDMNSKKHSGSFVNFSETAISYQDTAGQQTIPRQAIRRVKLMENKHRLRNSLIGGAVGAGAGAGMGAGIVAATYHSCSSSQLLCIQPVGKGGAEGIAAIIGFLAGAGVGALIGALIPSHNTIYSANSH